MKRKILFTCWICMVFFVEVNAQTWEEWFRQRKTQRKYLLQQIAKLQVHLGYLKRGYDIVNTGMHLVSTIKSADLNLHTNYFDHLKHVTPSVYRYGKITEAINIYKSISNAFKSNYQKLAETKALSTSEFEFIHQLFNSIFEKATINIIELTYVLTNYRLKMTDAERIRRIDDLYNTLSEKHKTFITLESKTQVLIKQRAIEVNDIQNITNLFAK